MSIAGTVLCMELTTGSSSLKALIGSRLVKATTFTLQSIAHGPNENESLVVEGSSYSPRLEPALIQCTCFSEESKTASSLVKCFFVNLSTIVYSFGRAGMIVSNIKSSTLVNSSLSATLIPPSHMPRAQEPVIYKFVTPEHILSRAI